MAVRLRLAALGHTMERGKVVEWYVPEGGDVVEGVRRCSRWRPTRRWWTSRHRPGGVLLRIDALVNEEYPVGATLAWIGDAGENLPDRTDETVAAPEGGVRRAAGHSGGPAACGASRGWMRTGSKAAAPAAGSPRTTSSGRSMRARRRRWRRRRPESRLPGSKACQANRHRRGKSSGEPPHDVIPLTGIRRVTAERLSAHWTGAPQVTEGVDIDMTEVRGFRTAHRDEWRSKFGVMPSLNDIVLKAVAIALESHPALNSALDRRCHPPISDDQSRSGGGCRRRAHRARAARCRGARPRRHRERGGRPDGPGKGRQS